jgi:hypothetical protein
MSIGIGRKKQMNISVKRILIVVMFALGCLPTIANAQLPRLGFVSQIQWISGGNELMVIGENGLFVYDKDLQLLRHTQHQWRNPSPVSWNADRNMLLVGNEVIDSNNLAVVSIFDRIPGGWLNRGTQVFMLSSERKIDIVNVHDGTLAKQIPVDAQLEDVVSSPDGTRLVACVANGIFVIDTLKGNFELYTFPIGDFVGNCSWSPDSRQIAFRHSDNASSRVHNASKTYLKLISADTGQVLQSQSVPTIITAIQWDIQDRLIAITPASVLLWATKPLTQVISFDGLDTRFYSFRYSPYGGMLAVSIKEALGNVHPQGSATTDIALFDQRAAYGAEGKLNVVLPEVSFQRLGEIQVRCVKEGITPQDLAIPKTFSDLGNYISQLKSVSAIYFPPACAADLLAIAEALQGK